MKPNAKSKKVELVGGSRDGFRITSGKMSNTLFFQKMNGLKEMYVLKEDGKYHLEEIKQQPVDQDLEKIMNNLVVPLVELENYFKKNNQFSPSIKIRGWNLKLGN